MDSASGQEVASPCPNPPARGSDDDSSGVSLPAGGVTESRDQSKDEDRKMEIGGEAEDEIKSATKKSPEKEDAKADDGPRQEETPCFPAAPSEKLEVQQQEVQQQEVQQQEVQQQEQQQQEQQQQEQEQQQEQQEQQQQRQQEEQQHEVQTSPSPSPSSSSSPQSTSRQAHSTPPSASAQETPEAALVHYASPAARRQPTQTHADANEDEDDIETIIPQKPRPVPQGRTSRRPRSLYLPPPPPPPYHVVPARKHACASDETTETETDGSPSAYVQSRRRDLGRDLLGGRRSRRSRRGPHLDAYSLDGYESERDDGDGAYADGFGSRAGRGAARWRYAYPQDAGYGHRYESSSGYEDGEGDGFRAAYPSRNVQPDPGSYVGLPRRAVSSRLGRRSSRSQQDKFPFDMADGLAAGSNALGPRGLRREGSVKRANNTSRVDQRTSGNSGMGGSREKGLRLRMDMNLEVEITLKARIQGGIEFSML